MARPKPFSPEMMSGSKLTAPGWYSRSHLKEAAAWKAEAARRMLTKAYCGPEHSILEKVASLSDTGAQRRFRGAHLVGFGFGAKESAGTCTGDLAVRIYVSGKKPLGKLLRWQRIPKEINGLPTDVIPLHRPRLHAAIAAPGTSIRRQAPGSDVGSLGVIVEHPETGKWFLITAAHVIAPDATAAKGDPIVVDRVPTRLLATLSDFEPLLKNRPNAMDAAMAEVMDRNDILTAIPRIGPVAEAHQEAFIYQSVRKFGATTEHTLGVVVDGIPSVSLGNFSYEGLICIKGCAEPFSKGGDSGSVVVDAISHRPIGLVTGGSGYESFVTPMNRIITRFSARFVS